MTIRLVLAAGPRLRADLLVRPLEREPDLGIVARCGDGEAVPWAVRVFRPDVLLLGLHLPPDGAVEVLRRLARDGSTPRVVVLAADLAGDELPEAVRLGARGVVTEEAVPERLARCVRVVHDGGRWLHPELEGRALDRFLAREADRQRTAKPRRGRGEDAQAVSGAANSRPSSRASTSNRPALPDTRTAVTRAT